MKTVKKMIAILLSLVMLFNVATASSLNDILLSNETYAGSWEDPSSGINYFSGGGIKVKFKANGQNFVPWVKIGSPGYNIGCNGISLEGGFLALLGLDDIERQLQDAGAAFAWGILIGLAYSLPAISTVFQQIQKWARQIQGLLQNMCNIGKNLTLAGTGGKKVTDMLQGTAIGEGFEEAKGFLSDIDKAFDKIEEFSNCATPECTTKQTVAISDFMKDIFSAEINSPTHQGQGIAASISKKVKTGIAPSGEVYYKKVPLSEILTTSNPYLELTENDILNIKLGLLFFGDVTLSQESEQNFAKFFDDLGSLDKEEFKEKIKAIVSEGDTFDKAKYELVSSKYSVEEAVDILLNGSSDVIQIPNYLMAISIVPTSDDQTKKTSFVFLLKDINTSGANSTNLAFEWGGFYKEGQRQVMQMLNTNTDGTSNGLFSIPSTSGISTPKEYIPVLIPSLVQRVNELRAAVLTRPELSVSASQTGSRLAQVNAIFATDALANEIYARVKKASINSTVQDKEIFNTFLTDIENIKKDINKKVLSAFSLQKDGTLQIQQEVDSIVEISKSKTLN